MRNLSIIILVLLAYSCNNNPGVKNTSSGSNPDKFFEINYEKVLENKQLIGLSQIASNVEYIKLETNENCMVRPVVRYWFNDSLIFISNFDHILKFSRDGRFLQKIGNPGRGPGEIDLIRIMSVLPEKRVIAVQKNAQREMLFFSYNGNLIKNVDFEAHIYQIKVLTDGKYITYETGANGSEEYTFCLMTEKWDTLSTVENYNKWIRTPSTMSIMVGYPAFEPFYFSRNKYHLKSMYNDTVYSINSDKFYPEYFINMGKFRLPQELRPERLGIEQFQKFKDNADNYRFAQVHESSNKIFLSSYCYGDSDSPIYVLYNKLTQKCLTLMNKENHSTGFVNDWDGGIDFWPIGSISDNQVFMPINPMNLQKALDEIKANDKQIRFPEKHKQLIDLISGLDVTDNPVIMVVTLKPDF
jgi:hypothetical protein